MKQYVKCMPNPGKNTPCYGCIFPHTHSWGDPYSCEWEEVYTGNRVYFLQTQPAYSESQMTTKYSSWDITQDGHQKLSMGYLNQDGHQPKALHGSSSEKAISNSSQMATKKKKKLSIWNFTQDGLPKLFLEPHQGCRDQREISKICK